MKRKDWLIVVGTCTHLGYVPLGQGPTEQMGRLVLPVPRLAVRHFRSGSTRTSA